MLLPEFWFGFVHSFHFLGIIPGCYYTYGFKRINIFDTRFKARPAQ